jgi:hypothetical protein
VKDSSDCFEDSLCAIFLPMAILFLIHLHSANMLIAYTGRPSALASLAHVHPPYGALRYMATVLHDRLGRHQLPDWHYP